ncbi:MAG: DnaA regulatory inactivator Hda [Gammaproteobacteria bacterium]|jgi:DnaA-homolog protein|nr:DnaA regulatory inactivator Hda [Gammaproteobacteria bacterium]
MMEVQLPLALSSQEHATFDNFMGGGEQPLIAQLKQIGAGLNPGEWPHLLYLWGAEGSGKSHLAHATCNLLDQNQGRAMVMPLQSYGALPDDRLLRLLDGIGGVDLLVVESVDGVVGQPAWDELLFHLLNQCRDGGIAVLVTARKPIHQLQIGLPDLRSRLSEGVVGQLTPLDDQQKWKVVQQRAEARGMGISDEVVHFLMNRTARDFHALFTLLDQLDRETLVAQRKITIPFVKKLLAL